ncbi:helix-turn-helix domain-containing protein [Mycobacterium marinum]|uniref:Transcriptional regulator (IclR family) n=1 Tax=Mycobacterium marinum (strain ATCC BAA-535 / M) TaxID=216594 RepID=B2HJY4_MYCMM|nr:helix-turn-helix domain-containing protein [Mycobacterium marinum]ACC41926.1 transcriptional regulator (IclR family) [Mycobacterium marinum M]MDC8973306.1 helix-turn-helix domain-containing protein [Mycobacterium marinum]MDC9004177.1 helix-turn-helix domain-containing protein [Mycobacterium marinum]RFZ67555.1 IclR helix-turn-helix domain protein [Mycobacterium marinum]
MTDTVDPASVSSQGSSPPTERVIAVLELLGHNSAKQFSLAEICRGLGISRATGHAILTTLAAREWVIRDPETFRYSWGPAIAGLDTPTTAQLHRGDLQELAAATGTQVMLARREDATLVVIDTVGECPRGPRISRGMRTPFVAPIGRDYVAWWSPDAQQDWLRAFGAPNPRFLQRMTLVLNQIQRRGFVVERLTRQYVRVYTALRALSADGEVDEITTQLARAYADLAIIDVLDEELTSGATHSVATISAPIRGPDGSATMTVMATVFANLDGAGIRKLGERLRRSAHAIEQRSARSSA